METIADEIKGTVVDQLRLIRRLNESRRVRVTRGETSVTIPSWQAVQDEIDALIAFVEKPTPRTEKPEWFWVVATLRRLLIYPPPAGLKESVLSALENWRSGDVLTEDERDVLGIPPPKDGKR